MNRKLFAWLTLDMGIFVVLNAVLIYFFGDVLGNLRLVTPFQLVVLGLAAYRAANILSNEVITKPLRAPFVTEEKEGGLIIEKPKKRGFLGATGLLIYCPSCTGVWLSAALVYSYALWPDTTFVIALLLALSACERIVARLLRK